MKALSRKAHIFIVLCKAAMLLMIISVGFSQCSPPHEKRTRRALRLRKDETRLRNGTIVGKYSYKDQEGNPINVKYYADARGYGVELKSLKVSQSFENPDLKVPTTEKLQQTLPTELANMDDTEPEKNPLKHKAQEHANSIEPTEQTSEDSIESMGNVFRTVKSNDRSKKDHRKTREYETFVEKKLAGVPKKYGNKKFRIYSYEKLGNGRDITSQNHRIKDYY